MVNMPQELHPIENILVLSLMSVRSGLSGGTYFWSDLDGVCFFHQITSLSLDPAQKNYGGVPKNS
jgi:expansin (peptidoglycan-binding protein)